MSPVTGRGAGRGPIAGAVVVFALSFGMFGISARVISMPPAWLTFEFCQYAEIGRNLAVDHAFVTRLVEPMALAAIDRDRVGPPSGAWPVVNRYPLPALAVAGWMLLLGPTDLAAACSNGLAISLLASLTYLAAYKWFGAWWAAVVALLFLANPSFYGEFLLLGTPDVWFAVVIVAELLVWSSFDPTDRQPRIAWAAGLGVLGGLAYLARFNASVFLLIQAAVLLRRWRWREALVMGLVTLGVASPILAYNWSYFHRPVVSIYSAWNLLDRIGAYRVEPWLYYKVPDLGQELGKNALGFATKLFLNLGVVVPLSLFSLWRLEVLMPLALIGPKLAGRGTSYRRFAGWSVGLFLIQLVLFSALRLEFEGRNSPYTGRYFFWFAAPAVLIGVGTMARLSTGRRWVLGLAGLMVVGQLVLFGMAWTSIARWHLSDTTTLGTDVLRKMLSEVVLDNRIIASNQPQLTLWASGLRSVSLPADPIELERLNRNSPAPVDYLLIDMNYNCIDLSRGWSDLVAYDSRFAPPWESYILRDYEYVLDPASTRPINYVFFRRKGLPLGDLERTFPRPKR